MLLKHTLVDAPPGRTWLTERSGWTWSPSQSVWSKCSFYCLISSSVQMGHRSSPFLSLAHASCHPGGILLLQRYCNRQDAMWLLQMGLKVGIASAWLSWDVHTCSQVTRPEEAQACGRCSRGEKLDPSFQAAIPLQPLTAHRPQSDALIPVGPPQPMLCRVEISHPFWALARWKIHKQN